jgi:hypothetical protein
VSKKNYNKKTIGVEKATFPRNKQWQIDQDYVATLKKEAAGTGRKASEAREALEYLSKFNNEYYGNKLKRGDPNALHKSGVPVINKETGLPEVDKHGRVIDQVRDCYDRNNRTNRDLSSICSLPSVEMMQLAEESEVESEDSNE